MCFTVITTFKTRELAREFSRKPLIATRNIRVFKILEVQKFGKTESLVSPYFAFEYKENETYHSKLSFEYETYYSHCWRLSINRGLHSFICEKDAKEMQDDFASSIYRTYKSKITEMYIPKGAKYFKNEDEYVSDTLVFKQLRKR